MKIKDIATEVMAIEDMEMEVVSLLRTCYPRHGHWDMKIKDIATEDMAIEDMEMEVMSLLRTCYPRNGH